MSLAIEDHCCEVTDILAELLGQRPQVLRRCGGDVDHASTFGTHCDLLHVDARTWVEHGSPLGHGDHGERPAPSGGRQRRPVNGVDGDVAGWRRSVADGLTVEQHRGFVLLALADDHDTVHRNALEDHAHGLDGRAICTVLVPSAHVARGRHGCGFGDPNEVESEVAVGRLW